MRKAGAPMEPVGGISGEQIGHLALERADKPVNVAGLSEQTTEPFEATIVRLDQSTAEEIFRLAAR